MGFIIAALLLRKFSYKIKDNINRSNKNNYFELPELRNSINFEIEHLQAVSSSENDSNKFDKMTNP